MGNIVKNILIAFIVFSPFACLFAAVESKVDLPRFSVQTMAVQQERLSGRILLGISPWSHTETSYQGLQLLIGGGVISNNRSSEEKKNSYEFISGLQNRLPLFSGLAIRSGGQLVTVHNPGVTTSLTEGLLALSLGDTRGVTIDFGLGLRWLWPDENKGSATSDSLAYDSWRLFPALSVGYLL